MGKEPSTPENIPTAGRVERFKGQEGKKSLPPEESTFKSYMEEKPPKAPSATEAGKTVTPMEITKKEGIPTTRATYDSITEQISSLNTTMQDVQKKLQTPKLELKPSQQYLLENKLKNANDRITTTSSRIGANIVPTTTLAPDATPIAKFLGYITDGENQLREAKECLTELHKQGTITPGRLVQIQVMLAQAQQEVEYASVLLSKFMDILRQLITGIQL